MSAYLQRPWTSSFQATIKQVTHYSANQQDIERPLGQVHKLVRNFAVSLDVGGPSVNHVPYSDNFMTKIDELSGRDRYLIWVKKWKMFYSELSEFIRWCKKQVRAKAMHPYEIERLKESAQVMLNARRVGKLASWAIVQRNLRLNTK